MSETDRLFQTGSTNGYDWLVTTDTLDDVLQLCPDIVLRKYLAVTAFDSGPYLLNDEEKSAGWTAQGGIAYSPAIEHIKQVPQDYFSELYVFDVERRLGALADRSVNIFDSELQKGQVEAFVNFDFSFHDPQYADLTRMFWQQLGWIEAESYLAENDFLTVVTSSRALFSQLHDGLRQLR